MFDLGWTELLVIGVVALIVVGPKDLPGMFRALGQFTAKMRRMAREFSRAMEDAADASGAKDIAKDLNSLRSMTSPRSAGASALKKAAGLDTLDDVFEDDDEGEKPKPARGPATQAMTEERAEVARKIHEHSARKAQERLDADAAAKAAGAEPADAPPAPDAAPASEATPAPAAAPAAETDQA